MREISASTVLADLKVGPFDAMFYCQLDAGPQPVNVSRGRHLHKLNWGDVVLMLLSPCSVI